MTLLAICTCSRFGSLAITRGDRLLAEWSLESPLAHSERLLPGLESLLLRAGTTLQDLSAIAVTRGPGSFTGLRVGIATAKALAWSAGLPLLGVSSLEATALAAGIADVPIVAIVDARRGSVYAQAFRLEGGIALPVQGPLGEPSEHSPREVVAALPPGALLAGDGAELCRDALPAGSRPTFGILPGPLFLAAPVARCASRLLEAGERPHAASLEPLYVRGAGAVRGRGTFNPLAPQ